ncbi:MAG: hypothetical protein JXP34_23590, partial [Planctomycetes bacterium]|nr:hypothetical protein [Planctomycetota bacterium]
PQGAECDIGAYEYTPPIEVAFLRGDANDDGLVDLGDPIFQLNYLFVSGPVPPPPLTQCGMDPTADTLTCQSYPACP